MALKGLVLKQDIPNVGLKGDLLGVWPDTALPTVTQDNEGQEIAEFVDVQPQAEGQVWDRTQLKFVSVPDAPEPTKLELEASALQPAYERWQRWVNTLVEYNLRNQQTPGTYSATLVSAVKTVVDNSWDNYHATIVRYRTAR